MKVNRKWTKKIDAEVKRKMIVRMCNEKEGRYSE